MNKHAPNWGTRTRRARSTDMLSAEEERHLVRTWQEHGDEHARDTLIRAFAPMAAAMAKRFAPESREADPDLVQQANIGLLKAADRFDPDRGYRFATYAIWWIRAEIQDYKRGTQSVVRRPNSAQSRTAAAQFVRLEAAMSADPQINRAGADAYIADALGIGADRVAELRAQITGRDYSLNAPPSMTRAKIAWRCWSIRQVLTIRHPCTGWTQRYCAACLSRRSPICLIASGT